MERRQLSVSDCELSVVIPAFNGMGFIKEQLDSLANQATTLRWEVIVADNGSTDQTRDYVTSRALEFPVPLRVVDASARRGVSHARNAGAIAARSDHVAICDCDDAVDRHWIDEIYKALQTADVVGGALSTLHVNDPVFTSSELALPRVVHTRVGPVQELNGCNMASAGKPSSKWGDSTRATIGGLTISTWAGERLSPGFESASLRGLSSITGGDPRPSRNGVSVPVADAPMSFSVCGTRNCSLPDQAGCGPLAVSLSRRCRYPAACSADLAGATSSPTSLGDGERSAVCASSGPADRFRNGS